MNFKKAAIIQGIIIVILVVGMFMFSGIEFTDNDYSPAGITNAESFEIFYLSLVDDTKIPNQTPMVDVIKYPMTINVDGEDVVIEDRQVAYKYFHEIFTTEVKKAIIKQKLEDIRIESYGVVIGDDMVVMGVDPDAEEEVYRILQVNN